ncbi:MAG: hypothetical protein KME30_23120 [Iphinoe sp. HA4291-MV1]|jgi:hypothetical protein|nr:hypothetical protein [Iphinoe sp. HA4291-MV1]
MISSRNFTQNNSRFSNTIWEKKDSSSNLRLVSLHGSANPDVVIRIQELAQKLANLDNVKRVRAVAPRFPNLHDIDFEIELQPETKLSYEAWEQLQNVVIECEWKLRDDSSEKWYFDAEVVSKLSPLQDTTAKVIADFHDRQLVEVRKQTRSSSRLKVVH